MPDPVAQGQISALQSKVANLETELRSITRFLRVEPTGTIVVSQPDEPTRQIGGAPQDFILWYRNLVIHQEVDIGEATALVLRRVWTQDAIFFLEINNLGHLIIRNNKLGIERDVLTIDLEGGFVVFNDGSFDMDFNIKSDGDDFNFHSNGGGNNVGIGIQDPNTSAKLEISSTVGSLLVPRMTTTQRDALTAANGMIIYNTTANQMQGYINGAWAAM